MAGFLAAVLSIAFPPMPGAGLTCYGLLLAQLNIPEEAMLMAVTLNIIFDFFCSGIDTLLLQLELLYQADALKMLVRETGKDCYKVMLDIRPNTRIQYSQTLE